VLHDIIGDQMIPSAVNTLQCIVNGEENSFLAIGDVAHRKHVRRGPSHRQHAQKIGKDCMCGSRDILSDRQTHRQMHSSQYFATALAGKVTTSFMAVYPGLVSWSLTSLCLSRATRVRLYQKYLHSLTHSLSLCSCQI